MILESTETLLFAGRAAILVVAFLAFAVAFGRWRRAATRDTERLFGELALSRGETRTLATVAECLVARLTSLEEKLETQAQLSAAAAGNAPRGYDLALRLARNGAVVEEITQTSGVTRQEAQLLARLHGPDTVRLRTGS